VKAAVSKDWKEMDRRSNVAVPLYPRPIEARPGVLVVEDDESLRAHLVDALRSDGNDVFEASDGAEALDYVVNPARKPDLFVCEVRIPVFSGLDLLSSLRRRDWTTPVILFDRFGDTDVRDEATRLGAETVFGTPFSLERLRAMVAGVLTLSRGPLPLNVVGTPWRPTGP
jgi:DNA-binding response OmpR family regulator